MEKINIEEKKNSTERSFRFVSFLLHKTFSDRTLTRIHYLSQVTTSPKLASTLDDHITLT